MDLNYPSDELNTLLEDKAAYMSTFIGMNSGGASKNLLKENFDELLPVFIDLIQNPAFPQDKSTIKTQSRSNISRRNDDQQSIGTREFLNSYMAKILHILAKLNTQSLTQ